MDYDLKLITPELVLSKVPRTRQQRTFIPELRHLLDDAAAPLYFLSDWRQRQITDVTLIQR